MRRAGLVLVAAAAMLVAAGCGGSSDVASSMSGRVSDLENASAACVKAGLQELAAERTRVFRCTWSPLEGRTTSPCYAMVDGELLDVTDRADEAFDCSH